ncbi:MAG TPA: molybdopterin-dependent oxidoreductase, partial [Anaerolineales bacterium]|nr:molybdopterin-dependent oxidoreductase [Anaerolineales bacterium]
AAAQAARRFSGSRLSGRFSGNDFPVTHSRAAEPVDAGSWRLAVEGAVRQPLAFSHADLFALSGAGQEATLDCTLGWYTVQSWYGVSLKELLAKAGADPGAFAVKFQSVTGYAHILPMAEAGQVLLATHVGEEVLEHAHGFPLRAVVPTRRGWFWVKWLERIEVIAI